MKNKTYITIVLLLLFGIIQAQNTSIDVVRSQYPAVFESIQNYALKSWDQYPDRQQILIDTQCTSFADIINMKSIDRKQMVSAILDNSLSGETENNINAINASPSRIPFEFLKCNWYLVKEQYTKATGQSANNTIVREDYTQQNRQTQYSESNQSNVRKEVSQTDERNNRYRIEENRNRRNTDNERSYSNNRNYRYYDEENEDEDDRYEYYQEDEQIFRFGITLGGGWSTISNLTYGSNIDTELSTVGNVGITAIGKFGKSFFMRSDLAYNLNRFEFSDYYDGDYNYIEKPYLEENKFTLNLVGGYRKKFGRNKNLMFGIGGFAGYSTYKLGFKLNSTNLDTDLDDILKSFDCGLAASVAFELNHFLFSTNGTYGLVNKLKWDEVKMKSASVTLSVSYLF